MDAFKLIGERIKQSILNRGFPSIEIFAHESQIPKSTLSELLNGKSDPRLSTLLKICSGLGISLSQLLGDGVMESLVREPPQGYGSASKREGKRRAPKKKNSR